MNFTFLDFFLKDCTEQMVCVCVCVNNLEFNELHVSGLLKDCTEQILTDMLE